MQRDQPKSYMKNPRKFAVMDGHDTVKKFTTLDAAVEYITTHCRRCGFSISEHVGPAEWDWKMLSQERISVSLKPQYTISKVGLDGSLHLLEVDAAGVV